MVVNHYSHQMLGSLNSFSSDTLRLPLYTLSFSSCQKEILFYYF